MKPREGKPYETFRRDGSDAMLWGVVTSGSWLRRAPGWPESQKHRRGGFSLSDSRWYPWRGESAFNARFPEPEGG
jgi:hypothetical protein